MGKLVRIAVGFSTEAGMKCSVCGTENLKQATLRILVVGIPEHRENLRVIHICQKDLGISSIVWIPQLIPSYEGLFDVNLPPSKDDIWGLK